MKAESGLLLAVPGDCCACFSLSLVETMAASVVLPGRGQRAGGLRFARVLYRTLGYRIRRLASASMQGHLDIGLRSRQHVSLISNS